MKISERMEKLEIRCYDHSVAAAELPRMVLIGFSSESPNIKGELLYGCPQCQKRIVILYES